MSLRDFLLVGGALVLVALCGVIDPPRMGSVGYRVGVGLAFAAFIMAVLLLAKLL